MNEKKNETHHEKKEERVLSTPEWKVLSSKQYEETIQEILKFEKQPTAKEWNAIAAKKGLLSSKALQYITIINII